MVVEETHRQGGIQGRRFSLPFLLSRREEEYLYVLMRLFVKLLLCLGNDEWFSCFLPHTNKEEEKMKEKDYLLIPQINYFTPCAKLRSSLACT